MGFGDVVGLIVATSFLTGIVTIISKAVVRFQEQKLRARTADLPPSVQAELDDLRAHLAEQEDLAQRVGELEERVDFAERMLAQAKQGRLAPGGES